MSTVLAEQEMRKKTKSNWKCKGKTTTEKEKKEKKRYNSAPVPPTIHSAV